MRSWRKHKPQQGLAFGASGRDKGPDWLQKEAGLLGWQPCCRGRQYFEPELDVDTPDQFWVTDITYIRTHKGFLYLAVVIDQFSRRVIGWSMQGRTYTDLPLQVLANQNCKCNGFIEVLRLKFQVQHPRPSGHRMLLWTNDISTSTARNVA